MMPSTLDIYPGLPPGRFVCEGAISPTAAGALRDALEDDLEAPDHVTVTEQAAVAMSDAEAKELKAVARRLGITLEGLHEQPAELAEA